MAFNATNLQRIGGTVLIPPGKHQLSMWFYDAKADNLTEIQAQR